VRREAPASLTSLFSDERVLRSCRRVVRSACSTRPPTATACGRSSRDCRCPRPQDSPALSRFFEANVVGVCVEYQEYFGYGMGANVYLTPASTQGFSPHYGSNSFFLCWPSCPILTSPKRVVSLVVPCGCAQTTSKRSFCSWRAARGGVSTHPWTSPRPCPASPPVPHSRTSQCAAPRPRRTARIRSIGSARSPLARLMNAGNFEQSEIGAVMMDVVLHAGDFLYFPRGWIHQVRTPRSIPAPCVSLTVCRVVSCVCTVGRRWRLRRTRTHCI
jgi:hypothetical protein